MNTLALISLLDLTVIARPASVRRGRS
jgi:hypothetical protein